MSLEMINTDIAGRDYQIAGIRTILEQIEKGRQKFLLVMATGTGKTRVAVALTDVLLRASWVKRVLFLVDRIVNLLRIGGRAGVIVPDGVLFGSSRAHRELRKMLIEECELQGVVKMPSGVFKPYEGVSTAVLVFVKGGKTKHVLYYDINADGYSLDEIVENNYDLSINRYKEVEYEEVEYEAPKVILRRLAELEEEIAKEREELEGMLG